MKTTVRWLVSFSFMWALATGCGGETPAESSEPAAPSAPSQEAAGGGGTCEETATASDAECHSCCVARGAAGNSWMGGDAPRCRCIGG